jgi:hypothetical protein
LYFGKQTIVCSKEKFESLFRFYPRENESYECSICLNNQTKHRFLQLSCKHFFHEKCAEKWLLECSNSCPLCRKIVDINDQFTEQLNIESMNNHNNMILESVISLLLESANDVTNRNYDDDTQFYLLLSPIEVEEDVQSLEL